MAGKSEIHKATFKILDAMDQPHGGRVLKLRFQAGETPSLSELRSARMQARAPGGEPSCIVRLESFALFGGKPSDERLARTGRIDVHVSPVEGNYDAIGAKWELSGPLS